MQQCNNLTVKQYTSALLAFLSLCTAALADSRQLPMRSINYMSYFNKAEFDERFPGKPIRGKTPTEVGYYVVYEHESLVYYFGPDEIKTIADMYKRELDRVVGIVKEKREILKTAKTYIVKLPTDEATIPPAESERAANEAKENEEPPEKNTEEERKVQPKSTPAPKPKPEPWWKRMFRWFGM